MVLAPDVGGEQVVERRDRPAPGDLARHLQPLGVLVEHRVDDVDERLVAVEQAVSAGQQVALEPALAVVLARAPPSPGRRGRGDRRLAAARRPRRGRSPRTPRPGGWTRSRRARRCGSARVGGRSRRAGTCRGPASPRWCRARARRRRRRSSGSRAARARAAAARRWRAGWRSCGARPSAPAPRGAHAARRARRRAPRDGRSAATASSCADARVCAASSASGTWWERNDALGGQPVDLMRARSSPWASAARSSASAVARSSRPLDSLPAGSLRSRSGTPSSAAPSAGASRAGSEPSTKQGR